MFLSALVAQLPRGPSLTGSQELLRQVLFMFMGQPFVRASVFKITRSHMRKYDLMWNLKTYKDGRLLHASYI